MQLFYVNFFAILLVLIIIFLGITIFFAIKNKKLKSHKVKANILYSGLSFLVFIVCFIFVVSTPIKEEQFNITTPYRLTQNQKEQISYDGDVYYVYWIKDPGSEDVASVYYVYWLDENGNELRYYALLDNEITNITIDDNIFTVIIDSNIITITINENSVELLTDNIIQMVIVAIGGVAISMFLIFGTYKSQYILDVRKQIKAEENGRVIEKYNQNIQVVNEQPQPQNEYKEEKVIERPPTTRTIPPLPPEIKARIEQDKKEDDTQ